MKTNAALILALVALVVSLIAMLQVDSARRMERDTRGAIYNRVQYLADDQARISADLRRVQSRVGMAPPTGQPAQ